MNEEIDQLCSNLGLKRMRDVMDRELARAAETGCAAEEVVARLLREQWQHHQEQPGYRLTTQIPNAGNSTPSLRPATRRKEGAIL